MAEGVNNPRFCGWCSKLLGDDIPYNQSNCTPVSSKEGCGWEANKANARRYAKLDRERNKKRPNRNCGFCDKPLPGSYSRTKFYHGRPKDKGSCAWEAAQQRKVQRAIRENEGVDVIPKDRHMRVLERQSIVYENI